MTTERQTRPVHTPTLKAHGFAGRLRTTASGTSSAPTNTNAAQADLNTSLETHQSTLGSGATVGTVKGHIDEASGILAQVVGTPRWASPELSEIAQQHGHGAALARAFQLHGEEVTAQMRGAYAFAILDTYGPRVILGVDRMGQCPLYSAVTPDGFLFGTSAHSVMSMQSATAPVSNQGVFNYVYFHMVPAPTPAFDGLSKLQAGCLAIFDGATVAVKRHWLPNFSEKTLASRPEQYQLLRDKLRQSVANQLPSPGKSSGKVGAFLSGGLDSSTVTGMLSELSDGPCHGYSIGFSAEGYDEMAFARITAEHFGAKLHEYYVTPEDVVEALPLIASSYDEPFGNSSALPAYFCAKFAAQDGVSLLLAGDGGDEFFAGNERYAKQRTFDVYQKLPSFLSKGLLEPLIRSNAGWLPLGSKAQSYIDQANTPLPDRLQTYNFLHQNAASEVFTADFLESVNISYPLEILREVYNAPTDASSLNRMLFLDWQFTLADNDLRKVSQTCALAGVDVAYPMLDDELVEFSLSIPSNWKLPGGKLRDFYKKALTGWLPDATINKSKQGFGLPFGVWMRDHKPLQEIAYDNIIKLKARNLFQDAFLDNAVAMHRSGHAAYFGELIWILCILELWMTSHIGENEAS